jgi:hypothetical protein
MARACPFSPADTWWPHASRKPVRRWPDGTARLCASVSVARRMGGATAHCCLDALRRLVAGRSCTHCRLGPERQRPGDTADHRGRADAHAVRAAMEHLRLGHHRCCVSCPAAAALPFTEVHPIFYNFACFPDICSVGHHVRLSCAQRSCGSLAHQCRVDRHPTFA